MTPDYMALTCATCKHRAISKTQSRPGPEQVWECRERPPTMFLFRTEGGGLEQITEYPVIGTGVDGDWSAACSWHAPSGDGDDHGSTDTIPF